MMNMEYDYLDLDTGETIILCMEGDIILLISEEETSTIFKLNLDITKMKKAPQSGILFIA